MEATVALVVLWAHSIITVAVAVLPIVVAISAFLCAMIPPPKDDASRIVKVLWKALNLAGCNFKYASNKDTNA